MATARDIPDLNADTPFREAAALTIKVRGHEVFEHEGRALGTEDIEGVHDMRVATRRLRAAMEIFQHTFPKKEHRRSLREVKRLADVLGERRDPDVMINRLTEIEAALTQDDTPGIESLVDELRMGQAAANERLERTLASVHESGLPARLDLLSAEARG